MKLYTIEGMNLTYAQCCLAAAVLFLAWRLLSRLPRSPLDNVPGPPSPSWFKGNIPQMFHRHTGFDFHRMLAAKYGSVVRVQELLGKKALYVFDPKAMYSVIAKDHDGYELSNTHRARRMVLTGPGLISTTGERHRAQRKMLTPVFSTAHMRYLTPVFYDIAHKLRIAIAVQIYGTKGEVDVLMWMGRTALELIGQGGLGHSFDPLDSDMTDTLGHAVKAFQPMMAKNRIWSMLSPYALYIRPAWLRRLLANLVPDSNFQKFKELIYTMDETSRDILRSKQDAFIRGDEAIQEQVGRGKDIMSILLKANLQASEEDKLSDEEVLAQMTTFILAGTDTTSSALARILDLLASRPEVQAKLRNEIREARRGQDLSYDDLVSLPYLDAVCRETLRLYAPVSLVHKEATRDMSLPLSRPIHGVDGTLMNEIFVPRGTTVFVGTWLSNINKSIWGDDADEWKPERWLAPPPESLKEVKIPGVYSNLMTFSGGGRSCIGFKFSQLEMKVVLSVLLDSFIFHPPLKPVVWNYGNLAFPSVGKDDAKPCLPLIVEEAPSDI